MLERAEYYFQRHEYKKSFLNLIQLSSQMSHDMNFLKLLARVQLKMKDQAQALKTVNSILNKEMDPEFILIKLDLLFFLKSYNEALDVGLLLQDLDLSFEQRLTNFKYLVDIYIYFNDFDGLDELLQSYKTHFSQQSYYLFGQGILCSYRDEFEHALCFLREAVLQDNTMDKAWVALSIMHNKMGDIELALANVEKALDVNPNNSIAIKCFAMWNDEKGLTSLACERTTQYLSKNCFDQEVIIKNIKLLKKIGHHDHARIEQSKFEQYFGQQINL